MATKPTEKKLVGSGAVASLFGVTTRRVQQLTQEGVIEAQRVKGANKYDLMATAQRYIAYLTEKANGREGQRDDELEKRKQEAEATLKESKAGVAKLQLRELEGSMHRSEDVKAVLSDLVYTTRSMLMTLPGRLAVDTSTAKTPAEASEAIRVEVFKVLESLAGYKYDPEIFAKRVRDRQGWLDIDVDDKDE